MTPRPGKQELLPNSEALLLDYAERLVKHLAGRRAVHVRLSRLHTSRKREQHLRLAAASFDSLIRRAQGQCFRLANGDLVVVAKDVTVAEIDEVVLQIRYMFEDDPAVNEPDDASERRQFCQWFTLESDYPAFLALARELHRSAVHARTVAKPQTAAAVQATTQGELEPLDPARLGKFEKVVAVSDLGPVLRRQPICRLGPDGTVKVVGNELYVSIDALGQRVAPEIDLRADPWLFQYLIALLDRRVMVVLPPQEAKIDLPTSLNLTLHALLSDEFAAFNEKLRAVTDKVMVAEINWVDALRDVPNYVFIRDYLKTRKWRVALDGLSATNYALIRGEALDADYMKIAWNPELADGLVSKARGELLHALEQTAPSKLVLMHCGEQAAVTFGRGLGIELYQGRYIDALLRKQVAPAAAGA